MAILDLSAGKQTSKQKHSVGSLIQQCDSCMIPSGRKKLYLWQELGMENLGHSH